MNLLLWKEMTRKVHGEVSTQTTEAISEYMSIINHVHRKTFCSMKAIGNNYATFQICKL